MWVCECCVRVCMGVCVHVCVCACGWTQCAGVCVRACVRAGVIAVGQRQWPWVGNGGAVGTTRTEAG